MANSSFDANANTAEIEKLRKDLKKAALDKEKVNKELKTQRILGECQNDYLDLNVRKKA